MIKDLYKVLGIPYDATAEDIKDAYGRLAMDYYPDQNKGKNAGERFKEIKAAYDLLSNESERKKYNERLFARINDFLYKRLQFKLYKN